MTAVTVYLRLKYAKNCSKTLSDWNDKPLQGRFNETANQSKSAKKKREAPFSLRLTKAEKAYLKQQAGNRSLNAYMREKLLGDKATPRKETRQPGIDDEQYAKLLGMLGDTRYSSNLNQLAKHANMGTLDVSNNTEQQLEDAYMAILAMRDALFMALGLKS
jgi:hypothetical protein